MLLVILDNLVPQVSSGILCAMPHNQFFFIQSKIITLWSFRCSISPSIFSLPLNSESIMPINHCLGWLTAACEPCVTSIQNHWLYPLNTQLSQAFILSKLIHSICHVHSAFAEPSLRIFNMLGETTNSRSNLMPKNLRYLNWSAISKPSTGVSGKQ